MLKKLILENWKSFRYAELPIDPLTILIGANASGKSNAIEALIFLSQLLSENSLTQICQTSTSNCVRGGEKWLVRKGISSFKIKAVIGSPKDDSDLLYLVKVSTVPELRVEEELLGICRDGSENLDTIIFKATIVSGPRDQESGFPDGSLKLSFDGKSYTNDFFISPSISALAKISSTLTFRSKEKRDLSELYRHVKASLNRVSNFAPAPSKMRKYSVISKRFNLDAANIAGFLASLNPSLQTEIEDSISKYISELVDQDVRRIWAEKVGRNSTDAMLYGEEIWRNESCVEIDARSMSDGTLRFIALLTALLTSKHGSQLVIEDVDDGFHPSRTRLLLRAIREIGERRGLDVLVTTHNPALLDSLELDCLSFVVVAHRDSQTGESLLTPLDKLENLPKLLASASLGDLVTQGAIERNLETEAIAP